MLTIDSYINTPLEIEKELIKCFSKEDELIIFDIGACEAEDSIKYSRLFPSATIYSFEPLPANQEKARKNIATYKASQVNLIGEALSDSVGMAYFYVSSGSPEGVQNDENWDYGNKSSSLFPPSEDMSIHHQWLKFRQEIQIKTNTLENYCKQHNIQEIDFAHIDVQGAELKVLAGAGPMIEKIKAVWMEVENVELYKGQPLKSDVEKYMGEKGFMNVLNTVNSVSGDQFYVNLNFFPDAGKRFFATTNTTIIQKIGNALRKIIK